MAASRASRHSLARNTLLNGVTQLALILTSFLSYPLIARGVSTEGFGFLAIVWILIGYLGIFDLGLGWAATKSVAQASSTGDSQLIRRIAWNALVLGLILGVVIGLFLYLLRETLVARLLNVPEVLASDAVLALAFVTLAIPFAVMNGISRGILQGLQRFDVMNGIQIGMAAVQWIGSIIVVELGYGILGVTILTVTARIAAACVSLIWQARLIPGLLRPDRLLDTPLLREVMVFGGWITVSRVISPLFLYVDRLMIGTFLSLKAVGYYTVPQETISRLLIVPTSLTMTLFPTLSSFENADQIVPVYRRSLKYLLVAIMPLTLILIVFADEILNAWMGAEFAMGGGVSFRILAVGFLFNALAQLPMTLLLSRGKPEVPAKFHMVEFPSAVLLALLLLQTHGIQGVAFAWMLRVIVDSVLLFRSSMKVFPDLHAGTVDIRKTVLVGLVLAGGLGLTLLVEPLGPRIATACAFLVLYAFGVWNYLLDDMDKTMIRNLGVLPASQVASGGK